MRGLYSHSREYRKILWRDHFPHISQILEGLHFGAKTCFFPVFAPARIQEKTPVFVLFMYWFRARGYGYGTQMDRVGPLYFLLGLFCLQLVFVAYGHLVWSSYLRLKFGLVFFAYSGK